MQTSDLTHQIVSDKRPGGPDGASNYDRMMFICEVFGVEELDLGAEFDFSKIVECKDLDTVEACKHLCLLKMALTKEMVDYDQMDALEGDITLNYLTLTVQRINWHLEHLGMGRRTPPFPGLN